MTSTASPPDHAMEIDGIDDRAMGEALGRRFKFPRVATSAGCLPGLDGAVDRNRMGHSLVRRHVAVRCLTAT